MDRISSKDYNDLCQYFRHVRRLEKRQGIGRSLRSNFSCTHNVAVVG